MKPIVELQHITFGYGATPALKDISLHIHRGDFVGVVGPSGAGKTTLLKVILGTLAPQSGEVKILGRPSNGRPCDCVGYIPQLKTVDWNFPVTAEEVVMMGRTMAMGALPWSSRADRAQVDAVMERLEIAHLRRRQIRDLSGGQQQRVFLARALVSTPELLVLDEPTTGVDVRTREEILHLLADLNRDGATILLTTHDLNSAAAHLPSVVCLNHRVVAQGAPEEIFTVEVLNETYMGDMVIVREGDLLFATERPHPHSRRAVLGRNGQLPGHHAHSHAAAAPGPDAPAP